VRISSLGHPITSIAFLNASRRGTPETDSLPVLLAHVDALPGDLAAVLVAADLQGVVPDWHDDGRPRLLGEELADVYLTLADEGVVPPAAATGVMLAGDLYSAPDASERGASGDVRSVWEAFASAFRWVVGVAGNHDRFGSTRDQARFVARRGVHLLDGDVVALDGLRVGGVGLIAGNPNKPGRRSEADQLGLLELVLTERPDVLVVHQGPTGASDQRGSLGIRDELSRHPPPLTICGHCHWHRPLFELDGHAQILNVDGRAVVLVAGAPAAVLA
jgi:Icc-related predicted phosphoesterase